MPAPGALSPVLELAHALRASSGAKETPGDLSEPGEDVISCLPLEPRLGRSHLVLAGGGTLRSARRRGKLGSMETRTPHVNIHHYRGQWVALDPATHAVVGHDPSLEQAEQQAHDRGIDKPLLLPVPEKRGFFVGLL